VLDADGNERWRIEGFLPTREFHAQLEMALARIVAMRKRWADAEPMYARIAEQFADTLVVAEALYWRGISAYQVTREHTSLERMATELTSRFPESEWAVKARVWV
jgi:outer membrane protein assembly factor BamD (BamD/ComL family)